MSKQPYVQYPEIYLKLLQLIRQFAEESDSDRLPSEENMAAQLGVSRVKVRDELSKLEAAGYVTRKRGVGTLINRYVLQEAARLDIDSIYVDIISHYGYTPKSVLRRLKSIRDPDPAVASRLHLQPGESVYIFEKLIYADDKPLILVDDYIPARYYDSVESDLSMMDSNIFLFLQGMSDEVLETLMVHMDAVSADARLADILALEPGAPLMKLDSVCYTKMSAPVMYSVEYFNTKVIPFSFQKRVLSGKYKRSQTDKSAT